MKFFIDTNILVHYLILSKANQRKSKKTLWREFKKIKPSYDFVKKALENKNKKIKFITSPLAFSEIFYAIYDEYICRRLFLDGTPFSSWVRVRYKYKLEPKDVDELYKDIRNLKKTFQNKIDIDDDIYDFKFIQKLVLKYGLRTHDAVLFSTARNTNCSFFVTKDSDFLNNKELKKYKKLKIISPEEAIQKLNHF